MRENRTHGSEGGGAGNSTGPSYPYQCPSGISQWAQVWRDPLPAFRSGSAQLVCDRAVDPGSGPGMTVVVGLDNLALAIVRGGDGWKKKINGRRKTET